MTEKWKLEIKLEYENKQVLIESFKTIVNNLATINYAKCSGGNSSTYFSMTGPAAPPLSDSEIEKIRSLLKSWKK